LPTQQQHKNLTIYRVGTGRKSFFFAAFWMGVKVLWKYPHIHLIHSSTYTSAFPASVLGKLFHKKTILTVHEIFGKLWKLFKPWYIRWGYQLFERLCFLIPHNAYHCVSLYTLNSLRLYYGISDAKLHLIYNGVDTEFWNAHHVSEATKRQRRTTYGWENKFLMLYYGHSGKSKGIDYLVQALPALLQQHPDAVLIFNLIPAKRDKAIKATLRQQAQKS
jgi:glycosyltransferase involved in cell wall biosynthesis